MSNKFSGRNLELADYIIIFFISLLCLTCILPFLHVAAKSLSSHRAVIGQIVSFWPVEFTLDSYTRVLRSSLLMPQIGFTALITILQTVLSLLVTALCAFPLSRRYLPGRFPITMFIMFTMYFSAGLIPAYLLYNRLHLLDTMWVLILPGAFSAFNMLVMRTYFMNSIPDSLEESALMDGAGPYRIFFQIWLPLSKPVLATVALWVAVGRWNGFGDAMYFTRSRSLQPIQLLLYNMILNARPTEPLTGADTGFTTTPEALQAAVVMFATIPILLVYPFLQKYFVKGIMLGAIKQ